VLSDGGDQVVTAADDGVLEITPNIVNLHINAPQTMTAGRSRTYAMDAGSMTLALQISDSVTGTLLAVAYDHQRSSGASTLQWATSVSNRAQQLKRELDAARAK
jgi:hypothetical protein